MKQRWFVVIAVALAVIGLGACSQHIVRPQTATVTGRLFGVAHIPRAEWPVEHRPEVRGELGETELPIGSVWITLSPDSAEYEIRRTYPADSLSITIGGRPATLHPDGSFTASDVPTGTQSVVFTLRGQIAQTQTVEIVGGSQPLTLEIERVLDTCCPVKPPDMTRAEGTAETFSCLDNNGFGPGNFVYSDCYGSLFYGPPWYSWMCWSEAMNVTHDHHGNIWCDGTHNCSLFIHGWDWNKQRWHRHYWPWLPRW